MKTVKYGETSLIVTVFTELFGIQSYLVSGVRVSSRKGMGKAGLFQPAAILDLVVYHNEMKQLNRLKEYRWEHLYQEIYSHVVKNSVALFLVELLTRCLKQPEPNPDLYHFTEDALLFLDECGETATANFPLFFALHLCYFFGFRIQDGYSDKNPILDLQEGQFVPEHPEHIHFLEGKQAEVTSELLKVIHPEDLSTIRLHHEFRRGLLQSYEMYYLLHIQDFGRLRTLPVLKEILG